MVTYVIICFPAPPYDSHLRFTIYIFPRRHEHEMDTRYKKGLSGALDMFILYAQHSSVKAIIDHIQ